jgi:hypothetical protein
VLVGTNTHRVGRCFLVIEWSLVIWWQEEALRDILLRDCAFRFESEHEVKVGAGRANGVAGHEARWV